MFASKGSSEAGGLQTAIALGAVNGATNGEVAQSPAQKSPLSVVDSFKGGKVMQKLRRLERTQTGGFALTLAAIIVLAVLLWIVHEDNPSTSPAVSRGSTFIKVHLHAGMKGFQAHPVAVLNPTITVPFGARVRFVVTNIDGWPHDLKIADANETAYPAEVDVYDGPTLKPNADAMPMMYRKNQVASIEFAAEVAGTFSYYCSYPGHRDGGMEGLFVVCQENEACTYNEPGMRAHGPMPKAKSRVANIVRRPEDIPDPIRVRFDRKSDGTPCTQTDYRHEKIATGTEPKVCRYPLPDDYAKRWPNWRGFPNRTTPVRHDVTLVTEEITGWLAPNVSFDYFVFNGTVPGPLVRVRVGDSILLTLKNLGSMAHSVDFHGITGQGGGAGSAFIGGTHVEAGGTAVVYVRAIIPGLFVYHCAAPYINQHISHGMYGMILVEPEQGLPYVDQEYYLMQGEVYTTHPRHSVSYDGYSGHQRSQTHRELEHETGDYYTFNGAYNAFWLESGGRPMGPVFAGDSIRFLVGSGGPNGHSAFHLIGEMFDRYWADADLDNEPNNNVQTVLVMPGGAAVVDTVIDVPGLYVPVDHALSRTFEKGLAAMVIALDESYRGVPLRELFGNNSATRRTLSTYGEQYRELYYSLCDDKASVHPAVRAALGSLPCSPEALMPFLESSLGNKTTTYQYGEKKTADIRWWPVATESRNSGRHGQRTPTPSKCGYSRLSTNKTGEGAEGLCASQYNTYGMY